MRILDEEREQTVQTVALFLTEREARDFVIRLERLLKDPEANEHFHVYSNESNRREISCSIVTPTKLACLPYAEIERKALDEK